MSVVGSMNYLFLTIKGGVKPSKVTWSLWGLFPLIVYIGQVVNGVGAPAWNTLAASILPIMVVIASIKIKQSHWRSSIVDYILAALALLGVIASLFTGVALYAMSFAIIADFLATIRTYRKSYLYPSSESVFVYFVSAVGSFISLISVQNPQTISTLFLVYLVFSNSAIFVLIKIGIKSKDRTELCI